MKHITFKNNIIAFVLAFIVTTTLDCTRQPTYSKYIVLDTVSTEYIRTAKSGGGITVNRNFILRNSGTGVLETKEVSLLTTYQYKIGDEISFEDYNTPLSLKLLLVFLLYLVIVFGVLAWKDEL